MSFIGKISGSSTSSGLRHRIFNLFLFFGGVASFIDLIIRLILDQSFIQIVFTLLTCVVFFGTYYIVRIKVIFTSFVVFTSAIFTVIILSLSFFFNSGTDVMAIPSLLFSLVVYFLSIRRPVTYYISALHLVSIITILMLQYAHPELISYYPDKEERL